MFLVQVPRRFCLLHHLQPYVSKSPRHDLCDILGLRSERFHAASSVVFKKNNNVLQPKLSPAEVSQILRNNEGKLQLQEESEIGWDDAMQTPSLHAIASADSNQLASNTPIEDKLAISKCLLTSGFLFGVFDGHGGSECSQVVSKRLFEYVAASLLPLSELRRIISEYEEGNAVKLTKTFSDTTEFLPELKKVYDASFLRWCRQLLASGSRDFSMEDALTNSFLQLDRDIGTEVLENRNSAVWQALLSVALSGCVACVAHIDGPHLHVANTGDCGALLGKEAEESHGGWGVFRLTRDHNWENPHEVRRVRSEHPKAEADHVIMNQRLLGMLMPFRAFGDMRFKWDRHLQMEVLQPVESMDLSYLRYYHTPPYLTARPEVTYHRLRPHEKFLVMASDGLWESMNALDIVTLVGEYMSGRQTLQPVRLPRRSVSLGEVSLLLRKRQEGLRLKPSDTNASTHLIRHCLGGTEEGLDHLRLSHSLTLPPEVRRYFRDDISIHVIFLDSNFLRVCPIEL